MRTFLSLIFSLLLHFGLFAQTHEATYISQSWTEMNSGEEKNEPAKVVFSSGKVFVELGSKKYEGKLTAKTEADKKLEFNAELNGKPTHIKILTFGKPSISLRNDDLNVLINCE